MTRRKDIRGVRGRGGVLLFIFVVCLMGAHSGTGLATPVIFKNDLLQVLPAASVLTNQGPERNLEVEVFEIPDASNEAIAYSATSTNQDEIYHHIYGYALPNHDVSYAVINEIQKSTAKTLSVAGARELTGKDIALGRRVRVKQALRLDGELLLAFDPMMRDLRGLRASLEIIVTQDRLDRDGNPRLKRDGTTIRTKRVFRGMVELRGTKKGKIKIKTKGKIRKKHISDISAEVGGLFRISFVDMSLFYKIGARVGQDYTLSTFVNSQVTTTGEATGAEINFLPVGSHIPLFQETGQIPEPGAVLFLIGGLLSLTFISNLDFAQHLSS